VHFPISLFFNKIQPLRSLDAGQLQS